MRIRPQSLAGLALALLLGLPPALAAASPGTGLRLADGAALPGCRSDADCKSDRVCRAGRCTAPGAAALSPVLAPAPAPAPALAPAPAPRRTAASRWEDRWGLRLDAGLNLPLWDKDHPFFFVDLAGQYGLWRGLSFEFAWTFGFLRQDDPDGTTGGTFFSLLKPGLRYRFLESDLTPYAGLGLGLAISHGDLQKGGEDRSQTSVGVVFELRAGVEWFLARRWALDLFVAYDHATGVVTPESDFGETDDVGVLLVGAGLVFLY
jgi:hypothetical protein